MCLRERVLSGLLLLSLKTNAWNPLRAY